MKQQASSLGPRISALGSSGLALVAVLIALGGTVWPAGPARAAAAAIELPRLEASRSEQALWLDFEVRFDLPSGVEDALQKGVALHFVAEVDVFRPRWYWRDKRIARAQRTWRLSYQPLTFSYRVSLGGLSQTYPNLSEAMRSVQRLGAWRIADANVADEGDYLEFAYRLDTDQLPRPLLISIGSQPEWNLRIGRSLVVPADAR